MGSTFVPLFLEKMGKYVHHLGEFVEEFELLLLMKEPREELSITKTPPTLQPRALSLQFIESRITAGNASTLLDRLLPRLLEYAEKLSNSGRVEEVRGQDALDVGFFSKGRGYAEYVEYGRRAGRFPPVRQLSQWARKKLRVKGRQADSIGFLIARKIARKGTRPQPFFRPAYERHRQEITDTVANAVIKETR